MLRVEAPFDQVYPLMLLSEVRVRVPPLQKVKGPFAIIAGFAGVGLTVISVNAEVAVQPKLFFTITEKFPELLTETLLVVCPFDQVYPLELVSEVRIKLPPLQKDSGPLAVIKGNKGFGFTFTVVTDEVAEHPKLFFTATV